MSASDTRTDQQKIAYSVRSALQQTLLCLLIGLAAGNLGAATVMITGQTAGPTPFISNLQLNASPANSVQSIKFTITPKVGSVTRPLSATYTSEYLKRRGYYNAQTGAILLPVFGLYSNFSNTVTLQYEFTDNSTQPDTTTIATGVYNDTCGYSTPVIIQPRTNSTSLSFDYILVRNGCHAPLIIDTDGQIRWAGAGAFGNFPAILFQNSFYLANFDSNLSRMEFDGTWITLHDFADEGISDFHHNIDFGKRGIILEADTPTDFESVLIEVDGLGNTLKTWNMADIISNAMIAGGDGIHVNEFVVRSQDWFHNNASTYRNSDNSVLVSSRENFVIALDYESSAIKWIFGDYLNKQWGQYASLTNHKLVAASNTLAPIGEHAISITSDDRLLLFDNGKSSLNHSPTGIDRTYSAPRKYQLSTRTMMATEVWNYEAGQAFYSPFCSSVYEDAPSNYLVDYAILGTSPDNSAEILAFDSSGNKIFHYHYPTSNCTTAFNSLPIHLENLMFTTMTPPAVVSRKMQGASAFDIPLPLAGTPGVECRSGGAMQNYQVVFTFASPVTVTDVTVTPGDTSTASVAGPPAVSGAQVTVNLTNVSDAQTLTVALIGVNDGAHTESFSVPMTVLVGDSTGNGTVNASDVSQVKAQSGQMISSANFRKDVTANGEINGSDVSLAKANSGHGVSRVEKRLLQR